MNAISKLAIKAANENKRKKCEAIAFIALSNE